MNPDDAPTRAQTFFPEMREMLQGVGAGIVLSLVIMVSHAAPKAVAQAAPQREGACAKARLANAATPGTGARRPAAGCEAPAARAPAGRLAN